MSFPPRLRTWTIKASPLPPRQVAGCSMLHLNNVPTTLSFTDDAILGTAKTFTLISVANINGRATGTSTVQGGTCILNITTSSYTVGTGPQENRTIG